MRLDKVEFETHPIHLRQNVFVICLLASDLASIGVDPNEYKGMMLRDSMKVTIEKGGD